MEAPEYNSGVLLHCNIWWVLACRKQTYWHYRNTKWQKQKELKYYT